MYCTKNWRISDDDLSDHRRISFACKIGVVETGEGPVSFDLKIANWNELKKEVRKIVAQTKRTELDSGNKKAARLQEIIQVASSRWIPVRKVQDKNNKDWWNQNIEDLRKSVKRKRGKWLQNEDKCYLFEQETYIT